MPGAKLKHLTAALSRMELSSPRMLATTIGINNRSDSDSTVRQELSDLMELVDSKPSLGRFKFMAVSCSNLLPSQDRATVELLNDEAALRFQRDFIGQPSRSAQDFDPADKSHVHCAPSLADRMLQTILESFQAGKTN